MDWIPKNILFISKNIIGGSAAEGGDQWWVALAGDKGNMVFSQGKNFYSMKMLQSYVWDENILEGILHAKSIPRV